MNPSYTTAKKRLKPFIRMKSMH